MGGPGTEFCIACEQLFCMNCTSLHMKMKGTKNHEFQSGGNIVPEVRLRCEEHKEDFLFRCNKCKVSICMRCVTGKHNGHKVSISDRRLFQTLEQRSERKYTRNWM